MEDARIPSLEQFPEVIPDLIPDVLRETNLRKR